MGGVFNVVNMHLYHYAGNNPVKYTDPDGRELGDLLESAQKAFEEFVTQFIKDNADAINNSSGRVALKFAGIEKGKFTLSGNVFAEATGEGNVKVQIEGAVDFTIIGGGAGDSKATLQVGLRIGYTLADSSKGNWGISLNRENISSLNLAVDATLRLGENIGANGHLRKHLYDFNNDFSWKDLAAKDWVVGGQANIGNTRVAGRFNISKWLGYGK
jgi:hypothetical protein